MRSAAGSTGGQLFGDVSFVGANGITTSGAGQTITIDGSGIPGELSHDGFDDTAASTAHTEYILKDVLVAAGDTLVATGARTAGVVPIGGNNTIPISNGTTWTWGNGTTLFDAAGTAADLIAALTHDGLSGTAASRAHTEYIFEDGSRAFSGDQSMGSHKITSLANAVADTDALPKGQADTLYSAIGHNHDTRYIAKSAFGAKGNILVGTGSGTYTAVGVGNNGQVLTADSGKASGVDWVTPAAAWALDLDGKGDGFVYFEDVSDTFSTLSGALLPAGAADNDYVVWDESGVYGAAHTWVKRGEYDGPLMAAGIVGKGGPGTIVAREGGAGGLDNDPNGVDPGLTDDSKDGYVLAVDWSVGDTATAPLIWTSLDYVLLELLGGTAGLVYWNGTHASVIANGANGDILTMVAGVPDWVTP